MTAEGPSPAAPAQSVAVPPQGPPPQVALTPGAGVVPRDSLGAVTRALSEFFAHGRSAADARTLALCGAAGVAGAVLLVGHPAGLGVALAGGAVWAAAVPALVRRRDVVDGLLALLSVALVAVVAVRAAGWVVWTCLLVGGLVGAVAVSGARTAPAVLTTPATWAAGVLRAVPWVAHGLGRLVGGRRRQVLAAIRTTAVTVALLVVFGALFASADQVFASYLPTFSAGDLPGRVVVGCLVALAAAASATLALAPPPWSTARLAPVRNPASLATWLTPLVALDVLVLAFVGVQVGGVLGGHQHVLDTAGLTYAQYARTGFGQLVTVTVLTLLVIAVAARWAPRGSRRDRVAVQVALGTLCVATLGVVASALRRLDLYVEAFGLTRLRSSVAVAEVVMGLVLVLVLVAGARPGGRWFARSVVALVGVAVLATAAANPDAVVLRHNTTADLLVPVDVLYLQGLSVDAVPAAAELDEPLRSCVLAGIDAQPSESGFGWNLGRQRAAEVHGAMATRSGSLCAGVRG